MNKVDYLLITLMEECAEIQKECSKCLRFGIGDKESLHNPNSVDTLSNVQRLNNEVNDLLGVIELLQEESILSEKDLIDIYKKKLKVNHFYRYGDITPIDESIQKRIMEWIRRIK